jgi:hypothetical protein
MDELMSKYEPLWKHIQKNGNNKNVLSFSEIEGILGFEIDHSFLNYKKELIQYGYEIEKISLKGKTIKYKNC